MAVIMRLPPALPVMSLTSPCLSKAIKAPMDDRGRLPGRMKLAGVGTYPYELVCFGEEKSSISLLRITPSSVITLEPKKVLIVVVSVMARPS